MNKPMIITTGIIASVLVAGVSLGYYYFVAENNATPFSPGNTIDATSKGLASISPKAEGTAGETVAPTEVTVTSPAASPEKEESPTPTTTPTPTPTSTKTPTQTPTQTQTPTSTPAPSNPSNTMLDWQNFLAKLWNDYRPSPVTNLEARLNNSSLLGGAVVVLTFDSPAEFKYTSSDEETDLGENGYYIFEEDKFEGMKNYVKNELPTYIEGSRSMNYFNSGAVSFYWEDKNGGLVEQVKFTVFAVRKAISQNLSYSISDPSTIEVTIKLPDPICGTPGVAISNEVNKNIAYLDKIPVSKCTPK